ncbi:hypothetical protein ACFSKU_19250 [Pontibacter silvestris]|uniref:Uncharacterized protein n=1 Tax=Pontibacter silvestris TaxID=2305183 RepID=A0ABW4X393_9BACT|nr:hypothetical protein [Pontibacter silvestris]MCC9134974.1 hypothetical protein [Pontibacter silvestris]
MNELDKLRDGLMNSSILLMKDYGNQLECSFVREGLVIRSFFIKDEILATALKRSGVNGIIEGVNFEVFRNTFDSFSLRVKAKKLYSELSANLTYQTSSNAMAATA